MSQRHDRKISVRRDFAVRRQTVTDTKLNDLTLVNEMFAAKKFCCATAYLKALSLRDESFVSLYRQLAAAVNDPLLGMIYSADGIISLINDSATLDETFLTAATLRAFFSNDKPSDYDMKTLHGTVKNFAPVVNNAPLSDLIYALMNFKDAVHKGADFYFGDDSELATYLEFVANVDNFKLDEIIQNAWKSAGGKGKMTGKLKSRTDTSFKKAIEILCERVNIFDETAPLDSDAGAHERDERRF